MPTNKLEVMIDVLNSDDLMTEADAQAVFESEPSTPEQVAAAITATLFHDLARPSDLQVTGEEADAHMAEFIGEALRGVLMTSEAAT